MKLFCLQRLGFVMGLHEFLGSGLFRLMILFAIASKKMNGWDDG
jgi:hypothetical protein